MTPLQLPHFSMKLFNLHRLIPPVPCPRLYPTSPTNLRNYMATLTSHQRHIPHPLPTCTTTFNASYVTSMNHSRLILVAVVTSLLSFAQQSPRTTMMSLLHSSTFSCYHTPTSSNTSTHHITHFVQIYLSCILFHTQDTCSHSKPGRRVV